MEYAIQGPQGAPFGVKVIPSHKGLDITLERGELFRLEGDQRGQVVQVIEGRIWLTQNGGTDIILEKGQTYRISGRELVLLEGLPAGRIRFISRPR